MYGCNKICHQLQHKVRLFYSLLITVKGVLLAVHYKQEKEL